jgi:calreticulin
MAFSKVVFAAGVASVGATTYFKDTFEGGDFAKRWTHGSEWKPASEFSEFSLTKGDFGVDNGLKTGTDARFYSATAPFDKAFDNKGKDLVVSYTVRYEAVPDCGGAYIKVLPKVAEPKKFGGDAPYAIMFGPDVCGTSTRKTHVIFTHAGKNHLIKKNVKVETDRNPHRYTLIVRQDNTYEVQIDGTKAESGSLVDDFDFLPPKTIKDPAASKPKDWVDESDMPDPADVKPAGHDDVPAKIPDPNAKKPEDWDEEEDGEYEAPQIDNPAYKGAWVQKRIPNPAYKGVWVHPEVANPEYKDEPALYNFCGGADGCGAVGFELWQVKAGSVFDDIIVTDSTAEAEAFAKETYDAKKEKEAQAVVKHDEAEKAKQEAERKAAEEKSKAEAEAKKSSEDKDDDEDEKKEL